MDLQRMLERCRKEQWSAEDLDWTRRPRELSRDDEELVVQLFTNMSGIELLAGAMFREHARRADDPTLKAIFETFVVDELRHADVAWRLARHYDRRRLRSYTIDPDLAAFTPAFVSAVRYLSDDVANAYITGGELMLDIALLRSINDHVRDGMSADAMERINRDESRHLAIDYHMIEHYGSDAYDAKLAQQRGAPARERVAGALAFARMVTHARPFFRNVFFSPMDAIDPTGKRLTEAFRHMQRLGEKPTAKRRAFGKFLQAMSDLYNHPTWGPVAGSVAERMLGVDGRFIRTLNTDDELRRAASRSYDELAEDALAAKSRDN